MGVVGLLAAVECVLLPLVALMFGGAFFSQVGMMAALLALGSLGFAAVGTLFAAMLLRSRSRDVLLPIVLYPITVPVIIAGVRGTASLLQPEPAFAVARAWAAMLLCFDVVFIALALWTFDAVMSDGA
jgi:ABC-type transport system involved in cytochrome c biogenesis permease component